MSVGLYVYRATNVRVIDGDTIDADVDLGFHVQRRMRFRLLGINAPERKSETFAAGDSSKRALAEKLEGKEIVVRTEKDGTDKYGRYLAMVFVAMENVNSWMVEKGYAVQVAQ